MKDKSNLLNNADEKKLTNSFYDACSDKDFRKYLDSLKIEDEILMKYTSSLEDSYNEYKNCLNCKNLSACENAVSGYLLTPEKSTNSITFSYNACPKELKRLEKESYKKNIELYEMPIEIQNATFKNMYKDDKARIPIVKYFKEFMEKYYKGENPKGIYLNGSFGSGKTYLIASLFNEMAKKNVKSVLIYYPEFLRSLKASFNNDYDERFNYTKKAPLLLLDDIGAENCSNWSRDEILGPILQYRMENHLPTFFTSNLTLTELEKSLSITTSGVDKVKARRIIERIKQLTTNIELISENRRD